MTLIFVMIYVLRIHRTRIYHSFFVEVVLVKTFDAILRHAIYVSE